MGEGKGELKVLSVVDGCSTGTRRVEDDEAKSLTAFGAEG